MIRSFHYFFLGTAIAFASVCGGGYSQEAPPQTPPNVDGASPDSTSPEPPADGNPPSVDAATTGTPSSPIEGLGPAIPQAYAADRYSGTWTKNPFLVEVAPVAVNQVSFAQDWALTGLTVKPNGESMAYIRNKQTQEFKRVTNKPDSDGFELVKANPNPDRKSASVEVRKGSETATLKYDEVAPAPAAAQRVPVPGQVPNAVPNGVPTNTAAAAAMRPGTPGVPPVGRPGVPPAPGMQGTQPQYPGATQAQQMPANLPGSIPRTPSSRRRLLIPPAQPAPGAPPQ